MPWRRHFDLNAVPALVNKIYAALTHLHSIQVMLRHADAIGTAVLTLDCGDRSYFVHRVLMQC